MSQEQRSTITGGIFDIYTPDSQEYKENRMPRVGQVVCFEDGRRFVFCSTVVDLAQNTLVGKPGPTATTVGASSPAVVGDRVVKIDGTDVAANAWRGGHLAIDGKPGPYKIKGNKAVVGAGLVEVTLYEPLQVALAGGEAAIVIQLVVGDVIVNTASTHTVGVTSQAIPAATAGKPHFFWVQTAGPAQVTSAGSIAVGLGVMATTASVVAADGTKKILGEVIADAGTDAVVDLNIHEVL